MDMWSGSDSVSYSAVAPCDVGDAVMWRAATELSRYQSPKYSVIWATDREILEMETYFMFRMTVRKREKMIICLMTRGTIKYGWCR